MTITAENVIVAIESVLRVPVSIARDEPLLASGLPFDSLAMVGLFAEFERLTDAVIPQEEAFELLGASVDEIASRLAAIATRKPNESWSGSFI